MIRFPKTNYGNYYKLLFVLLLGIVSNSSIAQMDNALKDVMHPAPNAASLGKYGDIPVGYHTGVPNVSIPIYTLSEGSVSVPISLSYHGSGIRVQETASWVGLGWALNAGGMITRTVNSATDECAKATQTSGFYSHYGISRPDPMKYMGDAGVGQEALNGLYDTEPDLFHFNFNGYSGKFVFDKHRDIKVIPEQDIRIEVNTISNPINGSGVLFDEWIITTPDGTRYYFGGTSAQEWSIATSDGTTALESMNRVMTSWYLVKIESSDRKSSIQFEYTDENYGFYNNGSEFSPYTPIPLPLSTGGGGTLPAFPSKKVKTIIQGKRLTRIYTNTHEVVFDANDTRQDLSIYHPNHYTSAINGTAGQMYSVFFTQSDFNQTYARELDGIKIRTINGGDCIKTFDFLQ